MLKLLAIILLFATGCSDPTPAVTEPKVFGGAGRMKVVSAQSFYWPGGYNGAVYVFRDSITGSEFVAFFRAGGTALQTSRMVGKTVQHVEDD